MFFEPRLFHQWSHGHVLHVTCYPDHGRNPQGATVEKLSRKAAETEAELQTSRDDGQLGDARNIERAKLTPTD